MNKQKLFERNVPGTLEILQKSTVGIAGCGGLGSNAAVSLVRAGIGKLIIADHDVVEESNLNRQYYFQPDIGKKKVEVLTCHLKAINHEIGIETIDNQISASDISQIFKNADILMSLTTRENTMQCGGNEALSLGKPLITSDTRFLRQHFSKGCIS